MSRDYPTNTRMDLDDREDKWYRREGYTATVLVRQCQLWDCRDVFSTENSSQVVCDRHTNFPGHWFSE